MKKLRHFFRSRLSSGEAGQALILVLIFLTLGSLTLVPTLTHISTALKTGEVYEQNTNELYTADAGIEDSLWRIKYDFMGQDYNPYDFETAWPYQTEGLNGMTANFTISNVWFPTNVSITDPYAPGFIDLTADEARQMIDSKKLVVAGSALPGQPYRVLVDFNPDVGDNLTVKSIGVWLPRGFNYTGNCTLQAAGQPRKPDHVSSAEAPGGWTVVWSYDAPYPYLDEFPNFDAQEMTFYFTFSYTPPADQPTMLPSAVAWITTKMLKFGVPQPPTPENVPVSWDVDTHYYKMVSEAGDTQIEAYSSKNDLRQMGDAMSGDYVAIGNSLLSDDDGDHKRDDWHTPGSFNLTSIPANADAVYAYLYWSGWRNEDAIQDVFSDTCTDFNEWDRDGIIQNLPAVPTGDGINNGTWNYTPSSPSNYYSKVDETTPNDTDYITGTTQNQVRVPTGDGINNGSWTYTPSGWPSNYYSRVDETTPNDPDYVTGTTDSGGYRLFTFSSFSVPADDTIDGLTIYFRAMDVSGANPNNNLYASVRVNGNRYDAPSSVDPTTTWTTYTYTFTTNPATGAPWTWQEINGGSSNPLQQFGVRSTDLNPDIQISMVYAQVDFSGGYRLFTFSAFTVPSGCIIDGLTVYFRAKDVSGTNPNNNLRASIRVNGNRYDASSSVDPTATWTTYSYTFTTNPATGAPWTWQEINGGSSNPLQEFGVCSTDLNPDIQVSMVYAKVDYFDTLWVIDSSRFQGKGSTSTETGPRTLTLLNSLNLASYGSGIFNISWDQAESGSLSDNDAFYYAFSSDNGSTWSPNYEAFHGNDPASPLTVRIPDEYVTNKFKVRFYFNFNSTSEQVFLDNVKIVYLPVDTGITFKIGNDQVYFNGSEPAVGPHDLTAGRSYAMLNTMWGDPYGFSYDCVRDVSALVSKYPIHEGEEHHTGNANYTVDGISADIRNPDNSLSDFAFAGWSLIIIYASPETAGHYIYIRDNNFAFHPGTGGNLDFDADGNPGGTITNFTIPNPITDKYGHIIETVAAKLTCFVVEGDDFTNDTSSIVVTGKNGHSKSLTNPSCELNDVWNGKSYPGTFKEGVDVDTFELAWTDGVVSPGDDQLQVDLYSLNDAWNLVYFIISIRSETHTSGTGYYTIRGG